ncbi:MAG: hypothetical protein ABIM30_05995 [candidate division WOR-3 bacterium]
MGYQKIYTDLEDYGNELVVHKCKQAFFTINIEQVPIESDKKTVLEDGTQSIDKIRGIKYVASISFSAIGYSTPVEAERSAPDVLLRCVVIIAQKQCFNAEDLAAFNAEVEKNWKSAINDIKRIWGGAFFEGSVSIV